MDIKYIVYITINLCNGKFYIGVHKTNPEVFDGYIGCGIYGPSTIKHNLKGFHSAVKKYGYNNFRRTTIKIFPNTEQGMLDAYKLESEIVNATLLKSTQCYNTALGGQGSNNLETHTPVYKYSLDGKLLSKYSCAREAALAMGRTNVLSTMKAIRNNCLKITNSSFGYYWSYVQKFEYQKSKKSRKIAQYTYSGKFLRSFDSIEEAQRSLKISTIEQAIRKNGMASNYQWRYYDGDTSDIAPAITIKNKNKVLPIIMRNKNNTEKYEYNCINDCIKENPQLSSSQINRVLNGVIKSHKGFVFEYKDKDIV